jgi:hypothetical protein
MISAVFGLVRTPMNVTLNKTNNAANIVEKCR